MDSVKTVLASSTSQGESSTVLLGPCHLIERGLSMNLCTIELLSVYMLLFVFFCMTSEFFSFSLVFKP